MRAAFALVLLGLVACGLAQTNLAADTVAALKQKALYSDLSTREAIWTASLEVLFASLDGVEYNATKVTTAVQIATLTVPTLVDPNVGIAKTVARDVRATLAAQTAANFAVFSAGATGVLADNIRTVLLAAFLPFAVVVSGHRNAQGELQASWNQGFLDWAGEGGRIIEYDSFELHDTNLDYIVELTLLQVNGGLTNTQLDSLNLFTALAISNEFINSRRRFVAEPLLDVQAIVDVIETLDPEDRAPPVNYYGEPINETALIEAILSMQPKYKVVTPTKIEFSLKAEGELFRLAMWGRAVGPPFDPTNSSYNYCYYETAVVWTLDACPADAPTQPPAPTTEAEATEAPTEAPSTGATLNTTNISLVVVGIVACVVAVALFTVHFKRGKSARRVYDRSGTPSSSRSHVKLIEFRDSTPVEA